MNNSETNIVLFDGVCNLCDKTVQFIIRNDSAVKFRFASLQSESGQLLLRQLELPLDDLDTLIYIRDDKYYLKSTAVLTILKGLGGRLRLLYVFIKIPRNIRDKVYDFIAKRRYKCFGKSKNCIIPTLEFQSRFLE